MSQLDKLVAEYESISSTDFWKMYLKRIEEYRETIARDCEVKDDPRREQGGIKAIDYILGRREQPNIAVRLLTEIRDKSKT